MPTLCADKLYNCVCFVTQEVKVCLTGVQTKCKLCFPGNVKGHSVSTQFADKMYSCFCWIVQGSQFYLSSGQAMCLVVFAG